MDNYVIVDLETQNHPYYGMVASPFCPDNYIVEMGWKFKEGGVHSHRNSDKEHERTTPVKEVLSKIDVFVACVGTGGTVSGTGRRLKELKPDVKIIAVEPAASPLLTQGKAGAHKIQGIGANFIPKTYDATMVDEIVTVTDDEAIQTAREAARAEGLLVGISSGAALAATLRIANRTENKGKHIVTLLPDTGERYLSTELFNI